MMIRPNTDLVVKVTAKEASRYEHGWKTFESVVYAIDVTDEKHSWFLVYVPSDSFIPADDDIFAYDHPYFPYEDNGLFEWVRMDHCKMVDKEKWMF